MLNWKGIEKNHRKNWKSYEIELLTVMEALAAVCGLLGAKL